MIAFSAIGSVLRPSMHKELVDMLVAPRSLAPLTVEPAIAAWDGPVLSSGELTSADGARFPVRAAVPRLVPDEDSASSIDEGATERSFGAKWEQYKEHERDALAEFQYRWFDSRFGFGANSGFAEFLSGKGRILDAGTGPGLCAARCASLSSAHVVGMDLSDSVTAASSRYADLENLDYSPRRRSEPSVPPAELRLRSRGPGSPSHA